MGQSAPYVPIDRKCGKWCGRGAARKPYAIVLYSILGAIIVIGLVGWLIHKRGGRIKSAFKRKFGRGKQQEEAKV